MALNIKDQKAERAVRELAALTGESIAVAVGRAAEERLQKIRQAQSDHNLVEDLMAIGRHCAALPNFDTRSADEILGYDENGLPT